MRRAKGWSVGLACCLASAAMFRYPGGTVLDPTTHRYSLSRNFFSDLGMTVAYNREPNRLGAAFFVLSVFLLVVGLGHAVLSIARQLAAHPAARRWARSAAVALLLAGVSFAGVAVTPENRAMDMHVAFTFWGWRIVPVVAGLLAVASFHSPGLPRRVAIMWLVVTILLAAYAALLDWGPSVATVDGLVVQVIAQKAAVVIVLAAVLFSPAVARSFT